MSYAQNQRIVSIDRVRAEIAAGTGDLTDWVRKTAPPSLFPSTATPAVITEFSAMIQWVQNQSQFQAQAKNEFARVADGWVVAHAKANGLTVVTQEVYAAEARRKVPLPNICVQFGVRYQNTYDFLRELNARFEWTP